MGEQNEITDYVLTNIDSYEKLNAPNKIVGEEKFKTELENLLNRHDVDIKPINSKIFGCEQNGTTLPFIVKAPSFESNENPEDSAKSCLESNKKHIELLGAEFVEEMSPISITNPKSVEAIKTTLTSGMNEFILPPETIDKIKTMSSFDVFAQDRRDIQNGVCVWEYITRNYNTMEPEMRTRLTTLLERLREAANQGYVFDFPTFPTSDKPMTQKNWDNLIVDREGPTFLDSSTIWKYQPREKIESGLIALGAQISLDLLNKKTTPEEAYTTMKQESERLSQP